MQHKIYFLAIYNRLVFCHQHNESKLILSGLCKYVSDAKTTITRQQISVLEFAKLQPIEVNLSNINKHYFLYKNGIADSWCVVANNDANVIEEKNGCYIQNAEILPNICKNIGEMKNKFGK